MWNWLLAPAAAFMIYLFLVGFLSLVGRWMAEPSVADAQKQSEYTGGEKLARSAAAPGYRPFFVIALFFAILHLGVLMIGSSDLSPLSGLYLVGLLLTLVALILG